MTKTLNAARTYDHKAFGRIGVAELLLESESAIVVKLNGQELSAQSVDHLLIFALQTLQDAYAGAKDAEDAQKRFDDKLGRILAGTIGTRTGGSGASEEQRLIRMVLRPLVKAAMDAAAWKELDEDERIDAIDAAYAGLDDAGKAKVGAAVQRKREELAAEAAAKAELAGAIKISL